VCTEADKYWVATLNWQNAGLQIIRRLNVTLISATADVDTFLGTAENLAGPIRLASRY
jgi:hypothetical protein